MDERERLNSQYKYWQSLVEKVVSGYLTWDEAERNMGEFIAQQQETDHREQFMLYDVYVNGERTWTNINWDTVQQHVKELLKTERPLAIKIDPHKG